MHSTQRDSANPSCYASPSICGRGRFPLTGVEEKATVQTELVQWTVPIIITMYTAYYEGWLSSGTLLMCVWTVWGDLFPGRCSIFAKLLESFSCPSPLHPHVLA